MTKNPSEPTEPISVVILSETKDLGDSTAVNDNTTATPTERFFTAFSMTKKTPERIEPVRPNKNPSEPIEPISVVILSGAKDLGDSTAVDDSTTATSFREILHCVQNDKENT